MSCIYLSNIFVLNLEEELEVAKFYVNLKIEFYLCSKFNIHLDFLHLTYRSSYRELEVQVGSCVPKLKVHVGCRKLAWEVGVECWEVTLEVGN